jgi:hypothetical protein
MIVAASTPDLALERWVQSLPVVRCVAPAFRPWTGAKDANVVPISPAGMNPFSYSGFVGNVIVGMTLVAGHGTGETYWLARVPSAHALVLNSGSEAGEDSFTAVIPDGPAPPRTVAALSAAPRAGKLGLGSTRAEVERILGPGRVKKMCGLDVVRYQPRPQYMTQSEMWFFYRDSRVIALSRYQAV